MTAVVPIYAGGPGSSCPTGWIWRCLTDVARLESGHTPSRGRADWWGGEVRWLALPDIREHDGQVVHETSERINEQGLKNSSARLLPAMTVCLSRAASVGYVALLGQAMATSQDFANWVCSRVLEPAFLMQALRASRQYLRSLSSGAVHKTIYMPELASLWLCVPGPDIQKRIAETLRQRLELSKSVVNACDESERGIESLTRQLLVQAFDARVPVACIASRTRTGSGTTPERSRADYWAPATIPWVKTAEVGFDPIESVSEHVSKLALREVSLQLLPSGTVLVAMYGQGKTRGQSAVLKIEATCNQACFAIWPNDTWRPEFLQLWLQRNYRELRALSASRGGNQANLNGALLNAFEAPVIPLDEQDRFVARVQAQLAELKQVQATLQAQRRDINLLPSRLLAEAFA